MFETECEKHIWLAAWIDTEGNIHLQHQRCVAQRTGYTWFPGIEIKNTDEAVMRIVQEVSGGAMCRQVRSTRGWKTLYRVHLAPNRCRAMLPLIRPFLVVKARQADLLAEALVLLRENQRWMQSRQAQQMLAANTERLVALRDELRLLNRRGYHAP